MSERSSFGPELRRARERRGLSLEEIAGQTKVSASLYRGLENNDLSRWPSGLFGRAFVRNYAAAVGLDAEEVCRRFVRLFPDNAGEPVPEMHAVPPPPPPVLPGTLASVDVPRLMLAAEPAPASSSARAVWRRVAAAGVDLGIAAAFAAAISLVAGMAWFWATAALAGALGHLVSLAVRGRTLGALLLLPEPPAAKLDDAVQQARRRAEAGGPVLVASRDTGAGDSPVRRRRSAGGR